MGSSGKSSILATDVLPDPLEADPAMKIYFLMCSRFCLYFCDRLSCIFQPSPLLSWLCHSFCNRHVCCHLQVASILFGLLRWSCWESCCIISGHTFRCSSVLIDVHRFSSMLSMLTTFRQFLENRRKIMKTGGNSEIFTKICRISSKITRS